MSSFALDHVGDANDSLAVRRLGPIGRRIPLDDASVSHASINVGGEWMSICPCKFKECVFGIINGTEC